jgi:hypothetical protein
MPTVVVPDLVVPAKDRKAARRPRIASGKKPAPDAPHKRHRMPTDSPVVTQSADVSDRARRTEGPETSEPAEKRAALGVGPSAVLGGVAGLATLAVAAWWFLSPATVHVIAVLLGVLAIALSVSTLRNPQAVSWQRGLGLLGVVFGTIGTLVLLYAIASAFMTLPDITGSGSVPTLGL